MIKQLILLSCTLIFAFYGLAQTTTIKGYAPKYIGKTITVNQLEDFISQHEVPLAISEVKADSTFTMTFENKQIQKIIIRSDNNFSYIYVEPNKTYEIALPLHDKDKPYRPLGNYVTTIFLNLDTHDINQKILDFNILIDQFYARNLYDFVRNKQRFLDKYKILKDSTYKANTTEGLFFQTFAHYAFADLDMSIYTNEMALRYIFDTYLNKQTVHYDSEYYMLIVKKLYSKLFSQLEMKTNNKVYKGILKKSPTIILQALEDEYLTAPAFVRNEGKIVKTHSNEQLRELAMIIGLKDAYNNLEYPTTNILNILDSIAKHPKYLENGLIAKNVLYRLTEVTAGNPAPDFALTNQHGKLIYLRGFENNYLYIHIFKQNYTTTAQEIELLKNSYQRYSGIVNFVSVYTKEEKENKKISKLIHTIPWDVVALDEADVFFKTFNVQAFPHYILIDRTGVVVAAPALGPLPNGEYLTIDKTFFDIQKMDKILQDRENEKRKRGE